MVDAPASSENDLQGFRLLEDIRPNLTLAGLYYMAGWIGLLLAVPPGYATLIWPPSGIAMGAVLVAGRRIWPGIFLGAAALNVMNAQVINMPAIALACTIALGSTLQIIVGTSLVRRRLGYPVQFRSIRDIVMVMTIAGPVACVIAATVGQAALFVAGVVEIQDLSRSWLTWWFGDTFGVLVFLPLTILSPWHSGSRILWKGRPLVGFSFSALATVLAAVGLTFFAWFSTHEAVGAKNLDGFRKIAADSESALINRIDKYTIALEAGVGFFSVNDVVTVSDWRTFTKAFSVKEVLPGISGIGFIKAVSRSEIDNFQADISAAGVTGLNIHPETSADELFIITLIEPIAPNIEAVGLDIAFEDNRREAAILARDTGHATITERIFLVQDDIKRAGFLVLRPLYATGASLGSVEERRAAFRGWIYAPFIGQNFLEGLTVSQDSSLTIKVYDGMAADQEAEIYSSPSQHFAGARPKFSVSKSISILDRKWTVVWESTPSFEASVKRWEAEIVLVSGLALTSLLAAILFSTARRETLVQEKVVEKTEQLAAREKEYASIFDTAAAAIILVDGECRILNSNTAARKLFGDLAEKTIFDILDDTDDSVPDTLISSRAIFQRKTLPARAADGALLFVEMETSRWTTLDGADRSTVILLDVTEESRMAADLAESELRLDLVLEGTGVGVFDTDLIENTMAVSPTWRTILGWSDAEDIIPKREWLSRVHPHDLLHLFESDRRCISGEVKHARAEYRVRRNDGETIWVRSVAFVSRRDLTGRALRITGTLINIEEQKKAQQSLELSEAKFRTAMKNAPIGEALVMADGRISDANDALAKFLGYERDVLLQMNFTDLVHNANYPRSTHGNSSIILENGPQSDLRFIHKDGYEVWGMLTSSLVEGGVAKENYAIVQILDVDERRKVEKIKNEFIAAVSHELRTPLTAVRGALGMLRISVGDTLDSGTDRLITIAQNNCARLMGLVNNILDLEKLVSGNMVIDLELADVTNLVTQIVQDLNPYSATRGVTIKISGNEKQHLISTNLDRFTQVLTNLISNAAKFSSEGSTVTVKVTEQESAVVISVADTGPGIPEEFHQRIFSRFAQANSTNTRNTGGTGLGLNISKELVESMGGQIGFTSKEGHGATFWFSFPLALAQELQLS